ncbi:thiol:disulfide interchange protein DsbA/DsbL [Parendozoicomonas haliclonae]|uniref:Thiol:disulfide interchange protein n=1 Tax=Parendozoicomonas haliclonae TaxID=1960125 RepID=A0A1X7AQG7_9GAMM|nr:thiol:disulfide interchange protein DsbA/DsbL [Parendozoicomonas haliclonae]SMA50338.1 Thiol:disulfide interchange protein DsbA precursor [Parendozoicomonas haliclonae]
MIKAIKVLVALLILAPMAALAADYQEGKHYFKLDTPVSTKASGKVEVAEAFWYGCPHCYTLEPVLNAWKNKLPEHAEFRKVPAQFSKTWRTHGQLYFALDSLDIPKSVHDDVFNAIHKQNRKLSTRDEMVSFVKAYGVSEAAFDKAFKSFKVRNEMRQADAVVKGSRIAGVPALIINGKYRISAQSAGGNAEMLKVADYLIEQEKKQLN